MAEGVDRPHVDGGDVKGRRKRKEKRRKAETKKNQENNPCVYAMCGVTGQAAIKASNVASGMPVVFSAMCNGMLP